MINGNVIYPNANDVNVSGYVFYTKTASGTTTLYSDSATTVAAVGGEVFDRWLAGNLVIVHDGAIYKPTSCKVASGKVTVDILTVASSTATVVTTEAALASGDSKTAVEFAKIVPSA